MLGRVAKLADASALGADGATLGGSNPLSPSFNRGVGFSAEGRIRLWRRREPRVIDATIKSIDAANGRPGAGTAVPRRAPNPLPPRLLGGPGLEVSALFFK